MIACLGDLQEPAFPAFGGLGWLIGVSRFSPHGRTVRPVWIAGDGVGVERGFHLLAAVRPVGGQGGVIRGRPAFDQGVPHDAGPGRFRQVSAGLPVAEDPPVVPELAELPVVPADDPALGLFGWVQHAHL